MESRIRESEDVVIEIEPVISFKSPLKANTVEIHIKREKEEFFEYELDGRLSKIGTSKASPFPTPIILLKDLVSFEYHYINDLLSSTIEDDDELRFLLCLEINKTASGWVQGPVYMFLRVNITPQRIYGGEEEEKETCGICLKEISYLKTAPDREHLLCYHEFHSDCLCEWLIKNTTCPVCGTLVEDEP